MSIERIINAWRSEEYRDSLNAEERSLLPENPAGTVELSDEDLQEVAGGTMISSLILGCTGDAACISIV